MCSLHFTSLLVSLILDQQALLSVAGNRSAVKKVGKLAKVELGQKNCDKFGKEK